MSDQTIDCVDCSAPFTITDGEQEFYASKGLSLPKRCKSCRIARKKQQNEKGAYPVTCAECGVETTVPFPPKPDRAVYCRDCFASRKNR